MDGAFNIPEQSSPEQSSFDQRFEESRQLRNQDSASMIQSLIWDPRNSQYSRYGLHFEGASEQGTRRAGRDMQIDPISDPLMGHANGVPAGD
jgi:hypothetical protein